MQKLFRYGAVASIFLLTAGPAAFAQNYNPNYGPGGGQSWNQGGQGGWNQGGQGGWNQGGFSGGGQGMSQGVNQNTNEPNQQDAFQELSKYGFNNIRNLQRSEGWEAHATKNGDRVHIFIDDDGMIATYRGD
jgi:hypothetical protein